jgi:hypothetical protein
MGQFGRIEIMNAYNMYNIHTVYKGQFGRIEIINIYNVYGTHTVYMGGCAGASADGARRPDAGSTWEKRGNIIVCLVRVRARQWSGYV